MHNIVIRWRYCVKCHFDDECDELDCRGRLRQFYVSTYANWCKSSDSAMFFIILKHMGSLDLDDSERSFKKLRSMNCFGSHPGDLLHREKSAGRKSLIITRPPCSLKIERTLLRSLRTLTRRPTLANKIRKCARRTFGRRTGSQYIYIWDTSKVKLKKPVNSKLSFANESRISEGRIAGRNTASRSLSVCI
jgi:hypothetical protein